MLLAPGVDQGLSRAALALDAHTKPWTATRREMHKAARPRAIASVVRVFLWCVGLLYHYVSSMRDESS